LRTCLVSDHGEDSDAFESAHKERVSIHAWRKRSVAFLKAITGVGLLVLVALYLFCHYTGPLTLAPHYPGLSVSAMLILVSLILLSGLSLFLLSCERKVVSALIGGSPDIAVKLIDQKIKNEESVVLASKRAYALAVSGQKLDLALNLARREMCRLISTDAMLYCAMAAARIYQLKGNLSGASAIAEKMLLTFPLLENSKGIRGRIYLEAKTIIESSGEEKPQDVLSIFR
jgi:hypothetical protein